MRLPALIIAGLLATAAPAGAQTPNVYTPVLPTVSAVPTDVPLTDRRLPHYVAMAQRYWGNRGPNPACPAIHITRLDVSGDQSLGTIAAVGSMYPGVCRIAVNPDILPVQEHATLCQIVFHEIGHVHGFGHTGVVNGPTPQEDPEGVMAAVVDDSNMPLACRALRRPINRANRKWCERHHANCRNLYPSLFEYMVKFDS